MKFSKSLFLAFAGLGLFACSNEEDVNLTSNGTKAITLSIETPQTGRSLQDPTGGIGTQPISINQVSVKFVGTDMPVQTIPGSDLQSGKHTFYGIPKECTGVAVMVNNENFSTTATVETGKIASAATCYGFATGLQPAGEVTGDGTNGDDGVTYQKYTISVEAKPITARIEAAGLQLMQKEHRDQPATEETSKYQTLNFAGVFLNGYMEDGKCSQTENKITITTEKNAPEGDDNATIWEQVKTSLLADFPETSMPVWGKTFPKDITDGIEDDNKVWAYNFFTDDTHKLPKLTVVFDNAKLDENQGTLAQTTRFAPIKNYKDASGNIVKLEAGNIYKITSLSIWDENISGNVDGNTDIAVEATVTVTPWTIKNTTIEWN